MERAAEILFVLGERGATSIAHLARTIGISGSAVHRILVALKRKGLIEQDQDSELYVLSWGVLRFARSQIGQTDIRAAAQPEMVGLRDRFQETVALGVRFGFVRVCIERVESQREVRWHGEIGRVDPLYVGATGKVLLAYLSPTELSKYLASVELKELTPRTITDRKTLERELTVVRERGYAVSDQDRSLGLSGLAAPIFLASGEVGAALVIGGPTQRCTEEQLSAWSSAVVDAAGKIATRLGHTGARP